VILLQGFYGQTVEIEEDRVYDGAEELWVRDLGDRVRIGVTKVGVLLMGGIESTEFFVEPGDEIEKGADLVFFETFKAVRYVLSPLSGEVIVVNDKVIDDPELFDDDPYGEAWLIEMRPAAGTKADSAGIFAGSSLISPLEYAQALERSEHCAEGSEVLLEIKKGSPTCRSLYGGIRGNEPGEGSLSWKDDTGRDEAQPPEEEEPAD
jgi:glycine cleavage system H protein